MKPHIELAAWDSECFGYPVGKISMAEAAPNELPGLLTDAKKQGYRLLYITLENAGHQSREMASDIFTRLKKINVFLADEKVFLQKNINGSTTILPENISVRKPWMPQETLTALALQAGEYSRFRTDKNFTGQEFEKMYARWIGTALEGRSGETVYVSLRNDKITGLVTLSEKADHANIELIAVDKAFRGMGIGKTLLNAASVYALSRSRHTIRLSTQAANKPAMAFYAGHGYEITRTDLVFHCWL